MEFKGWSVDQWRTAQTGSAKKTQVNANLHALLSATPNGPEWIRLCTPAELSMQVDALPEPHSKEAASMPLYGVPYAVKDNIDVQGLPTTAACPTFAYSPADDATIVAELRKAGAIVLGKTNLDQFATGLVGTRSPYGIPTCVFSDKHVSGGSSSGSAVVVGNGTVPFSLGTDTAGSGRVPAALNNLVGVKPTVGLWSTAGVVPACKSLDSPTVFAQGLRDAQRVFNLALKYDALTPYTRSLPERPVTKFGKRPVLGVPSALEFFGDNENAALFNATVENIATLGVEVRFVDCSPLFHLAKLLYEGPWVAERYWACREQIAKHGADSLDPTVRQIVLGGEHVDGVDVFDKEYTRQAVKKQAAELMDSLDALLMPTCPLNPKVADVLAEPIAINSQQGYYTNFVNLADLAALAIPAGFRKDGLPVGITLMGPAFSDFALLELASRLLPGKRPIARFDRFSSTEDALDAKHMPKASTLRLAVVGAHLSGMPLNWQLRKAKATLAERTTTSPNYRLFALETKPPKPGIRRDSRGDGTAIAVEVWDVPLESFGEFVAAIPAPLGIGKLELKSGEWVSGFIWDGTSNATEITAHGGWRAYIAANARLTDRPFTKVLVANRGEIAVRIMRTLRKLGIASVAIYSEPDREAEHVVLADESVELKGTTAAQTYLSIRKVLDAAASIGAEAIVPGYGFLSENAEFADLCEAEGFVFVGPSGAAMRDLGLKHSARRIAQEAGVPLVPGTGLLETVEQALSAVPQIGGYPVMLKSTAGGGGIGLQRVDSDDELKSAYNTVRHQGEVYFGDSGVFLESFVENARHVEVQVFGDGRGTAIALGERDCSLQRRNQKIIEETPAPKLPAQTAARLHSSAAALAASMNYKCAGTVEYIYDEARDSFYFLEVNARLQVEHPITEMVTGLDLVEWMLLVAADRPPFDSTTKITPKGAAMEARLYAENPAKDFRPSPGQITELTFPNWARVDGWARKGTVIGTEYDPTIAKIIVHGSDREEALEKLQRALRETVVGGVTSNKDYLLDIAGSSMFSEARMFTKVLDTYEYRPAAFEVLMPGGGTTVQDWPGRTKLWHIGVPPSGPMDSYSHRAANALVCNEADAATLEITLTGPTLLFHKSAVVAVTGGETHITVNGIEQKGWSSFEVPANGKLAIGKLSTGCRAYIAISGGIDTPLYLESRSTFTQGLIGGVNGRALKFGDIVPLASRANPELKAMPPFLVPKYKNHWDIAVTYGPHGAPDFFDSEFVTEFFASDVKVHYNSNRFGVRLIGPKPKWARSDGGEAGLHPSNAHDYVYSLGAVNFTGNEPVVLGCDGPSLGGFVCMCVIVEAEMWKLGQVKPGDTIRFTPISIDQANELRVASSKRIEGHNVPLPILLPVLESPVLYQQEHPTRVVYRQAGDRYILVEYGENVMDLALRYRVHQLTEEVMASVDGVVEMSPGVRSVHIEFEPSLVSQNALVQQLVKIEQSLPHPESWKVPSRVLHLPMCFEDSKTLSAVQRYSETIRSDAPWLPNNVDFVTSVNDLKSRSEIRDLMYTASFMVMGLGDVYLGAPCAVPLDPRQRLLGTKYNPSRSWTPNGTVGLGGMYMCIYTMESPGGYQLIGRTVPIWDKLCLNEYSKGGKPWLLKNFDQVRYYPVSEAELEEQVAKVNAGTFTPKIDYDNIFDFAEYQEFLRDNKESIDAHNASLAKQMDKFAAIVSASDQKAVTSTAQETDLSQFSDNAVMVYAEITGRFWKTVASEGQQVTRGEPLVILEAMKTEMSIVAPEDGAGKLVKIVQKAGDLVEAGDLVAVIEP